MKNYIFRTLSLCILVTLMGSQLQAQSQGNVYEFLDGNQVRARVNNSADMFWDLTCSPSYEVPVQADPASKRHSAFASSIWLGGMDQAGGLHVSAQTYRQTGTDFSPGAYRSSGQYQDGISHNTGFEVQQVLALTNGKILYTGPTEIQIFDPTNGASVVALNPNGSSVTRAIELSNGDILVYGNGLIYNSDPLILLDGTNYVPTTSISMANNVGGYGATLLPNGEVLFTGLNGTTRFDPVNQVELTTAPMIQGRYNSSTEIRPDGKVFVAGGSTNPFGTGQLLASTELYDPATDSWTAGPTMSAGRINFPIVELNSGEWMLAAGSPLLGGTFVDHYDPNLGTMTLAATLEPNFGTFTATVRGTGEVLIATDDENCPAHNVFLYTPGQNTIQEVPITGTTGLGSVLPNGNLFIEQNPNVFQEIDVNTLKHVDQPWEKIWKVTQGQIDQFRADQSVGATNFLFYPDIETWPAHGNTALGELADQAPFVDVNNDGVYDPLNDGDYPCIKGDQALWWTFNDDATPNLETGGDPFGVQVKTMAYAYDCDGPCPAPWLDHTTFYQYTIVNPTTTNYSDVYLGFWMDCDIGNYADDAIGCDTSLGIGFAYNGDADDETASGYGLNPPALGSKFVQTPNGGEMTNFISYENDFSTHGNPEIAAHYYGYMRSKFKDGSQLVDYVTSAPTNYIYTGDPGFCGGPGNGGSVGLGQPFDRRYLQSYGPFNLNAGDEVTFEVALIWARGFYNDNWGSVCELKNATDSIQAWFEVQPSCNPSVVGSPEPVATNEVTVFPNPTQGTAFVAFGEPLRHAIQMQVLDPLGRMIYAKQLMTGTQRTELSTMDLSNGVYLLKFQDGKRGFTRKLVVRH